MSQRILGKPLAIGTKTKYGEITRIEYFSGERYYLLYAWGSWWERLRRRVKYRHFNWTRLPLHNAFWPAEEVEDSL